jgi:hypothetical protein
LLHFATTRLYAFNSKVNQSRAVFCSPSSSFLLPIQASRHLPACPSRTHHSPAMASLCVTTTPPLLSRQPVPQHLRARNRIVQHTPDQGRPSTPRFLDQSLSVSGVFGNVVGSATCSAQPGPSRLALSTLRQNSYGKRAAEVIDLTHTTGGLSDTSSARQPKRARTVNNVKPSKTTTLATKVNGVDRRSKARRDKAEQQDKLTAESISWRQKYKKAFPTFVFYFDAIDPVTEGGMVKAVERLGAVRTPRLFSTLHTDTLACAECRQLLL